MADTDTAHVLAWRNMFGVGLGSKQQQQQQLEITMAVFEMWSIINIKSIFCPITARVSPRIKANPSENWCIFRWILRKKRKIMKTLVFVWRHSRNCCHNTIIVGLNDVKWTVYKTCQHWGQNISWLNLSIKFCAVINLKPSKAREKLEEKHWRLHIYNTFYM